MQRKLIVLAAALAVMPVAAAAQTPISSNQVVEGHTVFAQLVPDSGDLAAIAGSVQCQVLWFNNQVLFRVPAGTTSLCGDASFVYAYPAGAPDPRGNPTLRPTGRVWDFTDPNGAPWHVAEYAYNQLDLAVNQDMGLPDFVSDNATLRQLNYTAWVVETGPPIHDPTIQQDYNFVVLVDMTKLTVRQGGSGAPDVHSPVDAQTGGTGGSTRPTQTGQGGPGTGYVTLSLGGQPPAWS